MLYECLLLLLKYVSNVKPTLYILYTHAKKFTNYNKRTWCYIRTWCCLSCDDIILDYITSEP